MNYLIIEDEKVAAKRLTELIGQYNHSSELLGILQTVKDTVVWLQNNASPDLILMDIQLADGLSFEIFEQVPVEAPVIFTTAYDEYALRAFKVNSIDYLLKPIDFNELVSALDKYRTNNQAARYPQLIFDSILKKLSRQFKERFMIKVGEHIRVMRTDEIECFFSMEKSTFLMNNAGRSYAVNYSLDQIESLVDPSKFFRINRKYIISFVAISDIISYSNSRLRVKLAKNESDDIIVSREKVQEFKTWLEK